MLPIEFAHGLDDLGARDGRAAGWITGLASEGGKIMADVEWTAAGRAALESKEYRFISPTFYHSENGGEVTRIARAGLTNIPALPELKQVASQADPAQTDSTAYAAQFAALALKLGMPLDTDPETVLTAIGEALGKMGNAAAVSDGLASVPITAVATFMADAAKQRHEDNVDRAVTAAMQAGRLPPALEPWGRDLCRDKPEEFDRFLKSSPFDLGTPTVTALGKPPVFASALAPTLDPADAITAQLGLPQGSLRT